MYTRRLIKTYLLYFHDFRVLIVFQHSILVERYILFSNLHIATDYLNSLCLVLLLNLQRDIWLNYFKQISYSLHKNKLAVHQTNVVFKLIERHFRNGRTMTF